LTATPRAESGTATLKAHASNAETSGSRSARMSASLARNWWTLGLRGVAAVLFAIAVLSLPSPTIASLVLLFAAYVAADGAFAILAGVRTAQRGARCRLLVLEGATNLTATAAVLAWPALAIAAPFVRLVCAWAVVTGALLLAAAHRLSVPHGRWVLVLAGTASAGWGALATVADISDLRVIRLWLVGYAVVFGGVLLVLAGRLQRRHRLASEPA
jgi:uncharacterized membrane protein HdeD (DUF308 family)